MYTGIIQGTCEVMALDRKPGFLSYAVRLDDGLLNELERGASVSIDGICQTVREIRGRVAWMK